MMLLFFGGIMNLYWIAGLSAFVLVERSAGRLPWVTQLAGIALLVSGIVLIIADLTGA